MERTYITANKLKSGMILILLICMTPNVYAQFLNGTLPPQSTPNTNTSTSTNYKILRDESKGNIKRTVEIELEERTDKATLVKIAKRIKASELHEYERTFIAYRIKGGDGNSYWATTHFNPDLEVIILGTSQAEYESLKKTSAPKENIIGTWIVHRSTDYKIVAYKKSGAIYVKDIYPNSDPSDEYEEKYISTSLNNGIKLQTEDDFRGEYYLINSKGDLEFWSTRGNYYTAKKI